MILINKSSAQARFNELYGHLNESDRNNFSRVANRLLTDNFIYGQEGYDVDDYRLITRFKDVLECYFNIIDFRLYQNEDYKIFYLKSDLQRVRVKLRKLESVLLLTLAKIYTIKSLEVKLDFNIEVAVTSQDIIDEINKTRIYQNRLMKTDIQSALLVLKGYKVIDFKNVEDALVRGIKILPTILYIVNEKDIEVINERLKGLSNIDEDDLKGEDENEAN